MKYEEFKELIERKPTVSRLDYENLVKKYGQSTINDLFDEYINDGFITSINGKSGQILKVFKNYCIINTKNDDLDYSLTYMFYKLENASIESDNFLSAEKNKFRE